MVVNTASTARQPVACLGELHKVRHRICDQDVGPYSWVEPITNHRTPSARPLDDVTEVSTERPTEADVTRRRRSKRKCLPCSHRDEVAGEVGTGRQAELQRAPELGIYLHQVEGSVRGIQLEFDHRHAVPLERIEQALSQLQQTWVMDRLRARAGAAGCREFSDPPMRHKPPTYTLLVGSKHPKSWSNDSLLEQRESIGRPLVSSQVALEHRPELVPGVYVGHTSRAFKRGLDHQWIADAIACFLQLVQRLRLPCFGHGDTNSLSNASNCNLIKSGCDLVRIGEDDA